MKLLLDTQLLLFAAGQPKRLSAVARKLLADPNNSLLFSAASLWEVTIKNSLGRNDFRVEPRVLRRGLLDNGYAELPVTSEHAVHVDGLPDLHGDTNLCTSPPSKAISRTKVLETNWKPSLGVRKTVSTSGIRVRFMPAS